EHWGKWTGWERSTRVPMIIVPPRSMRDSFAKGGEVCEQPVGLIDLYPTLTDLCGVEAPEGLDGISLRSLLRSPLVDTGRKLLTQFDEGNVSIRSKRWRYIKYADGSEELYDLEKDPQEWVNLAGKKAFGERLEAFRSFEY
ncbi:MAG: sulfatase/phosphatase domain-containing protein, partial [Verrucomicrobiota bacterium]